MARLDLVLTTLAGAHAPGDFDALATGCATWWRTLHYAGSSAVGAHRRPW